MKYGCITGSHHNETYPVAASQLFNRSQGGWFVIMNGSGHLELALTATATIFGFAIVPLGAAGTGADAAIWQSSATAGADRVPVITNKDALFLLKADATVTQSMIGNACDMLSVNDGVAPLVDVGAGTTDILIINDLGINAGGDIADVVVKMNPAKLQAD